MMYHDLCVEFGGIHESADDSPHSLGRGQTPKALALKLLTVVFLVNHLTEDLEFCGARWTPLEKRTQKIQKSIF